MVLEKQSILRHPNGYTSVYAHLSKYADAIEKYVKTISVQNEKKHRGESLFKRRSISS